MGVNVMAHSSPISINTKKARVFDMKKNARATEDQIAMEFMTGDIPVPVNSFDMKKYGDKVSLLKHYLGSLPRYKFVVSHWDETTFKVVMPQAHVAVFVRVRENEEIIIVFNGQIVKCTNCIGTILSVLNTTADNVRLKKEDSWILCM
jgi:hypothetical protein